MIEKSFLQIDLLSERSDLKDLQFGLRFQICPGRIKVTQALRLRIQPNWGTKYKQRRPVMHRWPLMQMLPSNLFMARFQI